MRVRKALIVAIVLLFASTTGCVDKSVILLSQDLAAVQQVTTDELNKSIQQELPGVDAKTAEIYRRLAARLDYLKRGNNAIARSLTQGMKPDEIARLLKERPTE